MKQIFIVFIVGFLFTSCYDDKGNYSYDTLMALDINIPYTYYQKEIGQTLTISPTIITDIKDTDISYQWEIGGITSTSGSYYTFTKLAEGKELSFPCVISDYIKSPGIYSIRLHALQNSTGRSFYSSTISLSITSAYSGLIVLHGDEKQSDIGLLRANDFLVNEGTIETSVLPYLYTLMGNEKIPGKGRSIIQSYTAYLSNVDRAIVVAITDKTGVWIEYAGFIKQGNWNSLFNDGINNAIPQYYTTQDQTVYAIDDGIIYPRRNNTFSIFPVPGIGISNYYAGSPFFETSGRAQGFFFDKKTRGFVETTNIYGFTNFSSTAGNYIKQIVTSNNFNLAAMNADLLYLDKGGQSGHFMAVMEEDNGNRYLAEIDWSASSDTDISVARYNLSVLPDIKDAQFWAFGDDQVAMCYYATPSNIYRFTAQSNYTDLSGRYNLLQMEDGTPVNFDGEITMMKILKPLINTSGSLVVKYYNFNKIMLIGIYKDGRGTLYSLKLNESTGNVISIEQFTGFDKIFDANLKPI